MSGFGKFPLNINTSKLRKKKIITSVSSAFVLSALLSALEHFNGRVAGDSIFLAEFTVGSAVDLYKLIHALKT